MTRAATSQQTNRVCPLLPSSKAPARKDTEGILKRIISGCATNVAAFDETGELLCVSGSWRTFAEQNGFTPIDDAYGLYELHTCRKVGEGMSVKQVSLRDSIQRMINGMQIEFQEEYIFKGTASPRWFMTKAARVEMPDGFKLLVSLEDVTRRRQAEAELRNIGGRLINAQEEERKRIGRELHDDVSQRLALLSLEIDLLRPEILSGQDNLKNMVEQLSQRAQELGSDINRLSYRLHPFKLDDLGVSTQSLCRELSRHHNLEIRFRQQGFPAELSEEATLCIFRVAQESLHNVVKHSGASEAEVILTKSESGVRLTISDNGRGFDIDEAKKKKRLGLISIGERLRLVNGKVSIRSQQGRGTQIDVLVTINMDQR